MEFWEGAFCSIRDSLFLWLLKTGHPKVATLHTVRIKKVGGDWRLGSRKADAGIYVMHLMKIYNGDMASTLLQTPIHQVNSMTELRVCFCCDIVLNQANLNMEH